VSLRFKGFLWDLSGAFGDIGVLFPLAIALIGQNHFNPTALFLMAGLFYLVSAFYFRITMPVQPLKAMSAIAIATGLGYQTINAAGIIMGVILIVIATTGMSVRLGRLFPVSVVRGIQMGLGLMLISTSLRLIGGEPAIAAVSALILIITPYILPQLPPLIPVLIISLFITLKDTGHVQMGLIPLSTQIPDISDLWLGFNMLVLPQIALTFGNAIVATEATAKILYGERAQRVNFKNIPLSMGIANILSGVFGGAPMCHGSGGLTAHNKFGATSERSGYIMGIVLISLAIFFGRSILEIVSTFPVGVLGILLCYVGIQHSLFITDIISDRGALTIAIIVAITGFLTHNLTLGFITGLCIYYISVSIVRIKTVRE